MTDRDPGRLIDELERAARRRQPFLIVGLLAIVAGFLTFSIYINQLLEATRAQADQSKTQAAALSLTLDRARQALRVGDRKRVAELLEVAEEQTGELPLSANPLAAAADAGAGLDDARPKGSVRPLPSPAPAKPRPGVVATNPTRNAAEQTIAPKAVETSAAVPPQQEQQPQQQPPPQQTAAPAGDAPGRLMLQKLGSEGTKGRKTAIVTNGTSASIRCNLAAFRGENKWPLALAPGTTVTLLPGIYVCRYGSETLQFTIMPGDRYRFSAK
ncbi:MAG: hypothetical protein V4574_21715 [Pseudomonadota bacterium]